MGSLQTQQQATLGVIKGAGLCVELVLILRICVEYEKKNFACSHLDRNSNEDRLGRLMTLLRVNGDE